MRRFVSLSLAVAILVLGALMLASCSVDYTEDELKSAAAELIEKSYEVNEIYFGKGLPVAEEDSEAIKNFTSELDVDVKAVNYLPVTEECPYETIEELKELAADVYSAGYCEYLWKMAFEGLSTDDDQTVSYARYMTDYSGVLTVRADLTEDGPTLSRTYDTENITVDKMKKDEASITLNSFVDGKEDISITFVLKREADGWRLDQPTY